MARIGDGGDLLKCSFCGKSQKQVKKLIAGPGVYICDECIDLCNEIIEEELADADDVKLDELPKPAEIRDFLEGYVIGQDTAKRTLAGTRHRVPGVSRPLCDREADMAGGPTLGLWDSPCPRIPL